MKSTQIFITKAKTDRLFYLRPATMAQSNGGLYVIFCCLFSTGFRNNPNGY